MTRIRRGWRMRDVAVRCRLSTSTLGRHELGAIGSMRALERHAAALDLRVDVKLLGRGTDVYRLADEEHASIVNVLVGAFRAAGWRAQPEASFNEWGERGRIDLMACDPSGRRLVIVEVKAELADLQDLLGSLDVKRRLGPDVARSLGWPIAEVVTMLAAASTQRNRSIVSAHRALFAEFRPRTYRGNPVPAAPRELLWVPAPAAGRQRWLAGRRQVRR